MEKRLGGKTLKLDIIYNDDCVKRLKKIPDASVDLIITSPPYADNRKGVYKGVKINGYVEWFLPISKELLRVLKPRGSFVLNIKERTVNGERGTYVLELILEMKKQGWLWTEEYIWHKKNCYPGKWPNRFRDAWERCLHFTKQKRFKMYQDAVKVPMGSWAGKRLRNLSTTDMIRDEADNASGFGKNVSNWMNKQKVYPTNVIHMATECGNVQHSAAFPISLPSWFINLFTKKKDIVLDPFMGSGTTAIAAIYLNRSFIGMEAEIEYYKRALERIKEIGKTVKNDKHKKKTNKKTLMNLKQFT